MKRFWLVSGRIAPWVLGAVVLWTAPECFADFTAHTSEAGGCAVASGSGLELWSLTLLLWFLARKPKPESGPRGVVKAQDAE